MDRLVRLLGWFGMGFDPSMVTNVDRVTTCLELASRHALRPASTVVGPGESIELVHDTKINRSLYERIGADFGWTDRLPWSPAQWAEWVGARETWVLFVGGRAAGLGELRPGDSEAWIEIFGLLAEHRGRGLGGALLTTVLSRGLELAPRVLVETNSFDGPYALASYEARGMRVINSRAAAPQQPGSGLPGGAGRAPS